ncbi:MAG: hypothetical protein U9Q69_01840 [Nanoarchaeota archaeon]|nr:hypothetical protein [Nanoarchaeota archaeon]
MEKLIKLYASILNEMSNINSLNMNRKFSGGVMPLIIQQAQKAGADIGNFVTYHNVTRCHYTFKDINESYSNTLPLEIGLLKNMDEFMGLQVKKRWDSECESCAKKLVCDDAYASAGLIVDDDVLYLGFTNPPSKFHTHKCNTWFRVLDFEELDNKEGIKSELSKYVSEERSRIALDLAELIHKHFRLIE